MNRSLARLAGALTIAGLLAAAPASAGTYHVYTCKTPDGKPAPADQWKQIESGANMVVNDCESASAGSQMFVSPYGEQMNGFVAGLSYTAPEGTSFTAVTFDRIHQRSDQDTGNAYWASWVGVDASDWGHRYPGEVCGSGCRGIGYTHMVDPEPIKTVGPLTGTRTVYVMSGCVGPSGAHCAGDRTATFVIRGVDAEIADPSAPTFAEVQGSLAATGSAHRGQESLSFAAADEGGGLYRTDVELRPVDDPKWQTLTHQLVDANGGHCQELDSRADTDSEFAYLQPCVLSAEQSVSLDTTAYPDGEYRLRVRVEDAAGNYGAVLPERRFDIDNFPAPSATTRPSIGGTPEVGKLLTAASGSWTGTNNTYAQQWLRCADADPAACAAIPGATGVSYRLVAEDKDALVRVSVGASNADGTGTALSDPVGPVTGPATPAVTPTATPATTGSNAPAGSGTTGTQGIVNGVNGSGAARLTLSGPAKLRLGYGRTSRTTVTLRDDRGRAISGASVAVLQRLNVPGATFAPIQSPVITDEDGHVRFLIDAGPSRTLRFVYSPTSSAESATARDVRISVASRTSLRTNRSYLRNGQTVRFLGRVLSRPVPANGVVIDLQARVGSRWQSFRSIRSANDGKWHSSYRFHATSGVQTYTFRAVVRADTGFPYRPSTSKRVKVTVRG